MDKKQKFMRRHSIALATTAFLTAFFGLLSLSPAPALAQVTSPPLFKNSGTGSVNRTFNDRLGQVAYVKDYGARGDGTTDDTTAITRAVAAAGVGGTVIFDKAGTYIVTTIDVLSKQNINLPVGATIRRKTNATGGHALIFRCIDAVDCHFYGGGTIDGARTLHTTAGAPDYLSTAYKVTGILISGGSGHCIEGLRFVNMTSSAAGSDGSGILVSTGTGGGTDYAQNIVVQRNIFTGCTRNALQSGSCLGLWIHDNVVTGCNGNTGDGAAFQLEGEDGDTGAKFNDCFLTWNRIYDNRTGISISNHSAPQSNFLRLVIADNTITNCTAGNGIYVSKSTEVDVLNNRVTGSALIGAHIVETHEWTFAGNRIKTSGGNGLQVQGCTHFDIADNHFILNAYHGASIQPYWSGADRPAFGSFTRNQCWNNGVAVDANAYCGLLVVPRGVNPTPSMMTVESNWFGNRTTYGTATQDHGWADRYPGSFADYCDSGMYSNNRFEGLVGANVQTFGANAIADAQTGAGQWQASGGTVASANSMTLSATSGSMFSISGTTQINAITTSGWGTGSTVTLIFVSTPTIKHNTAGAGGTATILFPSGSDYKAVANERMTLTYNGTNWIPDKRTVGPQSGGTVAAAADLTLPATATVFHISTGTGTVNGISTAGWQAGTTITLIFDGSITVNNAGSAGGGSDPGAGFGAIYTSSGSDFSATANKSLRVTFDGTSWYGG